MTYKYILRRQFKQINSVRDHRFKQVEQKLYKINFYEIKKKKKKEREEKTLLRSCKKFKYETTAK